MTPYRTVAAAVSAAGARAVLSRTPTTSATVLCASENSSALLPLAIRSSFGSSCSRRTVSVLAASRSGQSQGGQSQGQSQGQDHGGVVASVALPTSSRWLPLVRMQVRQRRGLKRISFAGSKEDVYGMLLFLIWSCWFHDCKYYLGEIEVRGAECEDSAIRLRVNLL